MELQDLRPSIGIDVERVGFRGIRRRVILDTPLGPISLDVSLSLYVDLPGDRRGVHLSRNVEALEEVLSATGKARSLEEYLEGIASRLLAKHPYASRAWAVAETVYYVDVEYSGLRSIEPVNVEIEVLLERGGGRRWGVSVEVRGLTVCPSAQETIASLTGLVKGMTPSHMQRVTLKGRVETTGEFVRIEKVARALYRSLSAPAITLLKRNQEAKLIMEALGKPKLVEDVVREAVANIAWELQKLPDDTIIEVEALSMESIHPHDLHAYKKVTLGMARKALTESSQHQL